ncbi:MAG: hypothetical protein WA901_02960 [Phormidesmis sp.]
MLDFSHPTFPRIDFLDLSDSIDTLARFANQLQTAIAVAFAHPLIAVAILLLSIGLLQLAADLMKRLLKAVITFILTLPFTLSQWLWKKATTAPESKQTQVDRLMAQLETLRQEQDQVLEELKILLASGSSTNDVVAKLSTSLTPALVEDRKTSSEAASGTISGTISGIANQTASKPKSSTKKKQTEKTNPQN